MGCGKGQFYGITIVFHWILENFISNLFEILYLTLCQFISVCRERSVKISLNLKFSINSELDCPIRGRCKWKYKERGEGWIIGENLRKYEKPDNQKTKIYGKWKNKSKRARIRTCDKMNLSENTRTVEKRQDPAKFTDVEEVRNRNETIEKLERNFWK